MAGECGEVCDAVKKLRRLADGTNTAKDPQTEHEAIDVIADELADLVIYADLLAARLGIDLGQSVQDKFNAVSILP
jgi:NTP pyrophosphatase (non-canonical NTP hydrolase)